MAAPNSSQVMQGRPGHFQPGSSTGRGSSGRQQWRSQQSTYIFGIVGVTRDSTGVPLGNCMVHLFKTQSDQFITEVMSDAGGNFRHTPENNSESYYLVAYKPGGTDVAGTTVNTLIPR